MSLLEDLQVHTGLGQSELRRLVRTAPLRYKMYLIPKRSGGQRVIAQPAREVKALQYYLLESVLKPLPIHDAASAYRDGRNIAQNAKRHTGSKVTLKLDFVDFFHSVKPKDFVSLCLPLMAAGNLSGIHSREDLDVAVQVLFWGQRTVSPKCLSIGAPTSPILSNILMWNFDTFVAGVAAEAGVIYTRYADDISISANHSQELLEVERLIRAYIARNKSPELTINEGKRGLYTSGQKRLVTGLVVTPERKVSLGRDRKRMISSLVHRFTLNQLPSEQVAQVQGLLAFARDVEPVFLASLRRKYGVTDIERLLQFRLPRGIGSRRR